MTPPPTIERAREQAQAVERVRRYIAEYEDARSWGGPPICPTRPSIADLRLLLSLATDGGWQTIDEKQTGDILAYSPESARVFQSYRSYAFDQWDQSNRYGTPTHWRPLPEPPVQS